MAIVKMNKFTLLALESEKSKLLERLQTFEGVQFINLQNEEEKDETLKELSEVTTDSSYTEYGENLSKIKFAIDFITPYSKKESALNSFLSDKREISYNDLAQQMKDNSWKRYYKELKDKEERLNEISSLTTKIETEISLLKKWSNFDAPFKYLNELKYTSSYLGTFPKQYEEELINSINTLENPIYYEILNRDNTDVYFFALEKKIENSPLNDLLKNSGFSNFQVSYSENPTEEIRELNSSYLRLINEEDNIKESLYGYVDKISELQIAYEYFNTLHLRAEANNNFLRTRRTVAIYGWNTEESNEELVSLIEDTLGENYYISFSEVREEEAPKVPIKLKNGSFASNFESVIEMYSMPQYSEIDPTPILSIFYFLFYGMMLSDAGYGLIMVIATSFALWRVKDKERRKTFKLFLFAGISTVFWGAIYGSWFGDLLPKYFGINIPFLLDPANNILEIFIISLVFGIIHIFIGLGTKAYILIRSGAIKDAVYDVLTWYAALIGAILMLLGIGGVLGKILLFGGLIALLFTQGRSATTIGGKIGGGVYGVYGITGYLGDVVSYSRLLALGLATGFIANALNLIISLIPSPFKFILAPFLFVGLHLFNLTINALGSYVHAARLQYLEFFSKFYEGGGKKFTPFKLSDKFIKITK